MLTSRYALLALVLCAGSAAAQAPPWAPATLPAVPAPAAPSWLAGRLPAGGAHAGPVAARSGALAFETYAGTRNSLGHLKLRFSFVGFLSTGDLDGDGLDDLLTMDLGSPDSGIDPQLSVFAQGEALGGGVGFAASRMLEAVDAATWVGPPALIDLDLDGDLDVVVSAGSLSDPTPPLVYYENVGTPTAPQLARRATSAVTGLRGFAFAADLDADGRTDLAVTRYQTATGTCSAAVHRNVGAPGAPALAAADASMFPSALPSCVLTFLDGDEDGDLDVAVSLSPVVRYLRNDGTRTAPSFADAPTPFADPQAMFTVGAALDLDADGRQDLAILRIDDGGPRFDVYRHDGPAAFTLGRSDALRTSLGLYEFGGGSFADLDGDGDLDLVVGGSAAMDGGVPLVAFRNVGTASVPRLVAWPDSPVAGLGLVGDFPQPAFADLDADGLVDLTVTFADGTVPPTAYFRNVGTPAEPAFASRPSPLAGLSASQAIGLSYGDVDGDGDLDAALTTLDEQTTALVYAENVGTPTAPSFAFRTGPASPLPAIQADQFLLPTLTDLDGDGRADLVITDLVAQDSGPTDSFRVYRNADGTFQQTAAPALENHRGFGFVGVAAADLTGDGLADLFVSDQDVEFFDVEVFWTLYTSVSEPVSSGDAPTASAFRVRHAGAHPARGTARIEVLGAAGVRTVEVFDVLGRLVARLDDAPETVSFAVGGWAPGRYAVRVSAGRDVAVLPLTVVR